MTGKEFLHKTTKDLLISFIVTYFFISVPELILPGLISAHFNPKYLLVAIIVLGWLFAFQRKNSSPVENKKFRAISRNLLNIVLSVITVMLILSLYKMKIWQIFVVAVFSVALFITAEKMYFFEEKEG